MKVTTLSLYIVTLSIILTVLSTLTKIPINQVQTDVQAHQWMHPAEMNRKIPAEVILVPVVAPWTKLPHNIEGRNVSEFTRSFVFADPTKIAKDHFNVKMSLLDQKHQEMVSEQLVERLCIKSDQRFCKREVEILKCITCTEEDGTWYSATSQTGAIFGRVEESRNPIERGNDGPFTFRKLDIAVPVAGKDEQLEEFAEELSDAIQQFRAKFRGSKIAIRLLFTRFSFDSPSPEDEDQLEGFRENLTEAAGLFDEDVVFVPVQSTNNEFSRAKAINALHQIAHHDDNSALAVIDVDFMVSSKFLRNALTFPFPRSAAYFPIVWSEFNPESVKLVQRIFNSPKVKNHSGEWRKFGYGMYVIAGSDAARLSMDESFEGWGGEDTDFLARVKKQLHVVRLLDTGLTHVWHQKHCKLGGFVKDKNFRNCIASMSRYEGSQLGMYLMHLKEQNATQLEEIMEAATQ
ncbi:chondroitin N-acetylgalactosaminyltransferase [Nitzschia inconspicua]|uniref:Chondroitin N-acetylgalactosaminyltransferase n=1 Tax=Nitzschia inconspicua TaxID=303405 RepID=A0A9K3KJZ0_9STRA|nr:chondroitin N-acetylgalactosaminyltransferase [Nitzschia inconspicua]